MCERQILIVSNLNIKVVSYTTPLQQKLEGTMDIRKDVWKSKNICDHIKSSFLLCLRHHFADKVQFSQSYGFSSSHVYVWELDYKESWVLKNWCFWTVVLEKTLESPMDSEEIKPVNLKRNQSWIFIGRTDAEAETPILWPPHAKSWIIGKGPDVGKDWGQEEKGKDRGWDGWMASLTYWAWVWASSGI